MSTPVSVVEAPVADAAELIPEASQYVYRRFKEDLPDGFYFHTYLHTTDVVRAVQKIGAKSGLSSHEMNLLTLAAWFHDVGFTKTSSDHETTSAEMAREYLEARGLPDDDVDHVAALIISTRLSQEPETLAERVLHDADLAHLGKSKRFFAYAQRLRKEYEERRGTPYTELEWQEIQLDFLTKTSYKTEYAQKRLGPGLNNNLKQIRQIVGNLLDANKPVPHIGSSGQTPNRGVQTMFRAIYRNHINLSSIADSKASLMISVNAILMSIIVSFVSTQMDSHPILLVPSSIMLVTSLAAIVFAIMSARPKVTSERLSLQDVRHKKSNILFFGTFANLEARDFRIGLKSIMEDTDSLYDSMINDLHGLGSVLQKKYRLLWVSFTVFMVGLILTVGAFLLLLLFPSLT